MDCGMLTVSNEDLAAKIKEDLGVDVMGWGLPAVTGS